MPPMEVPARPAGPARGRRPPRRWVRIALAVLVIIIAAASARLFVWPDQGMPARVSAIVRLDAPGPTSTIALRLATQHRAPFLVFSLGAPGTPGGLSPAGAAGDPYLLPPVAGHDPGRGRVCGPASPEIPLALHRGGHDRSPGPTGPAADGTVLRWSRVRRDGTARPASDHLAVSDRLRVGSTRQSSGPAARLLTAGQQPHSVRTLNIESVFGPATTEKRTVHGLLPPITRVVK